jgi:hypothetical protein
MENVVPSSPGTFAGGWSHTAEGHQAAAFLSDLPNGVVCLQGESFPTARKSFLTAQQCRRKTAKLDHVLSTLPEDMHCNGNSVYIFLFWEYRGLSPDFHIHVSVSDLYIPRIGPH